jgi:hypothetical protein
LGQHTTDIVWICRGDMLREVRETVARCAG